MRLEGRAVSPGKGDGTALVSGKPMSFLGGVDQETGRVLDPHSDVAGETVAGRVLAFPHGKGSTVGSYVLYGLAKRRAAPAAMVNDRTETIVATGCILGGIPLVDRVDTSVLLTGDHVLVDGGEGVVEVPAVTERPVVTAFLRNRGRILVVRRGDSVGTFRGAWSGVSGYIEGDERPVDRVRQEIREETAMVGIRLRAEGAVVRTRHEATVFAVHPFLFDAPNRKVRLDWENVEARWIQEEELAGLKTVPRLADVLGAVLRP